MVEWHIKRNVDMERKILITFPCTAGQLLDKIQAAVANGLDKHEICTAGYDGNGDCIFVTQDYLPKQKQEKKDISKCKHKICIFCCNEKIKKYNQQQMNIGGTPFVCPFKDGNECKEYESLNVD